MRIVGLPPAAADDGDAAGEAAGEAAGDAAGLAAGEAAAAGDDTGAAVGLAGAVVGDDAGEAQALTRAAEATTLRIHIADQRLIERFAVGRILEPPCGSCREMCL
jgi:hypothetical protein